MANNDFRKKVNKIKQSYDVDMGILFSRELGFKGYNAHFGRLKYS